LLIQYNFALFISPFKIPRAKFTKQSMTRTYVADWLTRINFDCETQCSFHFILSMGEPSNLVHFKGSNAELTELVKSTPSLVLIDFYAEWCGPCQNLGKQLPGLASQYPGVKFVKVNVEENKEAAGAYKVRSIPYIIVAKGVCTDGSVESLETFTGANVPGIKGALEKHQ
jgi:thioredoxin 1